MPPPSTPFVPFGPAHLGALGLALVASVVSALVARRDPQGRPAAFVARLLAAFALLALFGGIVVDVREGVGWRSWGPFQLCDVSVFLAVDALVRRRRGPAELLWFWGLSGSVLAMVTPDIRHGWPEPAFFLYFGQHAAVVASAVTAGCGLGLSPRRGAAWRAFGWTLAWAALMGALDAATGANFLYLRERPSRPTVLDWFGPWPLYLAGAAGLALGLFALLALPFGALRPARRARGGTR